VIVACGGLGCRRSEPGVDATTTAGAVTTTAAPSTTAPRTTNRLLTDVNAVLIIDDKHQYTPEQRAAIEAYVRAEQATIKARLAPIDMSAPDLGASLVGAQLSQVLKVLSEDSAAGHAVTEPKTLLVRVGKVQEESPTRFLVESCHVSDSHLYEPGSGRLLEEDKPFAVLQINAMEYVDGSWKLESWGKVNSWPGSLFCLDPLH
jgi:hypothetical protein